MLSQHVPGLCQGHDAYPTFRSQVLSPLHVIHHLKRLRLFLRKSLFVIIFARSTDSIQENATGVCVSEEVDGQEDQGYQDGRAKRREQTDDDAVHGGRAQRHICGSVLCCRLAAQFRCNMIVVARYARRVARVALPYGSIVVPSPAGAEAKACHELAGRVEDRRPRRELNSRERADSERKVTARVDLVRESRK